MSYYGFRYYDADKGRWVSKDPIGEWGGRNLYGFCLNMPNNAVDPVGNKIKCCNSGLPGYLTSKGVTGYTVTQGQLYSGGTGLSYAQGSFYSEILYRMIKSPRTFRIKNNSLDELKLHLKARYEILRAASTKSFGFPAPGTVQRNAAHWTTSGSGYVTTTASAALKNIWDQPALYSLGCLEGTAYVMLYGISKAMDTQLFNANIGNNPYGNKGTVLRIDYGVAANDWIPGDWGYIDNLASGAQWGQGAMNIIYYRLGYYWGHAPSAQNAPVYNSLQGWINTVSSWSGGAGAQLKGTREYPKLGLAP